MVFQEVVAPDVEVPAAEGEVAAGGEIHGLVEEPGVDGAEHRGDGAAAAEGDGVAEVFVVVEGVGCIDLHSPPGVGALEEAAVARQGAVQVEGIGQVGEAEAVVQVEGGDDFGSDVEPFADGDAIADEGTPVGAARTGVEVDAGGKVVAEAILEGGVGLQAVDARAALQRGVAIELAVADGSGEVRNLCEALHGEQQADGYD